MPYSQKTPVSSMRKVLACLVVAAAILAVGCRGRAVDMEQVDPEKRIVIKFSHVVSEFTPKGLAARRFARLVEERTGGRVEVQVYPNSKLYKDGEELKALMEGNVQIIAPATAKMTDHFPSLFIFDLPYLFENYESVHQAIDGELGRKLFPRLRGNGIKALATWGNGFKQMTATRPLHGVEDFSGLRFRIMPSRVLEAQFRYLGASTVPLPFNEVYSALELGRVEAAENTFSNIFTKKFYEVQPYMTVSNHGYLGYIVLVNEAYWEKLPTDIRQVLEATMREVTIWQRQVAVEHNDWAYESIKATGKTLTHHQTPEEREAWREALSPIYEQFEPLIGKDLLDLVRLR